MGKFDEKIESYKSNMDKLGIAYDVDKLIACTKALTQVLQCGW